MLTIKEYATINELDLLDFADDTGNRKDLTHDQIIWRYYSDYIHYVEACIHDGRLTNSKQ